MDDEWHQANLRAITERLAPLRYWPDGVMYDARAGLHHIRILKQHSQLLLYFVTARGALDGPMSRIDLDYPLRLLAPYTQALLLALLWQPAPERICVLGFGGGRISLVLHHVLPQAIIDNVEIDQAFATIAPDFFGIAFDARQQLHIADARAFLASTARQYDMLLMDAFTDDSDALDHLATAQFYALCTQRLARVGVLGVNLLRSDPRLAEKLRALRSQFPGTSVLELKHSLVVFGLAAQRRDTGLVRRAAEFATRYGFDFPFVAHAAALRPARAMSDALLQQLRRADPLDDARLTAD